LDGGSLSISKYGPEGDGFGHWDGLVGMILTVIVVGGAIALLWFYA
jgi:hypothetical protein